VPSHHQCIVSLSTTKWNNKYIFIHISYIKTARILFSSRVFPRWFGYPVCKVNFGIKIIQTSLTWSSQWLESASESLKESIFWDTWSRSWLSTFFIITFMWGQLKQMMFLWYTVCQLFCIYNMCYM
jgi:hypothetical protein